MQSPLTSMLQRLTKIPDIQDFADLICYFANLHNQYNTRDSEDFAVNKFLAEDK